MALLAPIAMRADARLRVVQPARGGEVSTKRRADMPQEQSRTHYPRKTNVAHRGASAYAPEHTIAACRLAIEQGADYVELADVVRDRVRPLTSSHASEGFPSVSRSGRIALTVEETDFDLMMVPFDGSAI